MIEIDILGCGEAFDPDRANSAVLVKVEGFRLLIDCGMGVPQAVWQRSDAAEFIDAVYFTHLHVDHCGGLPALIDHMGARGRKKPLVIYGPDAELARVLKGTGLQVQEARDESAVWGKLLINLANALCALTHASFEHLLRQPDMRRLFAAVLDEAVGVLDKAGIAYQLPMPIPYRRYRLLLLHGGPVTWWVARLRNGVRPGSYPSMVADVEQGRVTEVDQLNGEVVRLGQAHGLPTPVASRIVALVQAMNGQRPPRYLSAADLRRELGV